MKLDQASTGARPPTLEELSTCNDRARASIGHPHVLSWKKENKPTYLLTVTYGAGTTPPTWILHAEDSGDAAVVWIAMTTDLQEIFVKLKKGVAVTSSYSLIDISKDKLEPERRREPLSAVLSPGAVFADNYEIISKLGEGGMGIVYKAKQLDTNEFVGLKVLHPHLLTDNLSRARFEQEAQKSNLTHRNLIRIHKFGFSSNKQPFIAMEYLEGCSLSDLLATGPLSQAIFTNIFSQVCEGLYHAHSKGVIHRDIKPGNIMICKVEDDSAIVKIVDFGIAKSNIVAGADLKLTPTGEVLGSPLYMSPEQCAGGASDPRSDIYSLGCVMYESITGAMPFYNLNPIKLILMQISEKAPTFKESNPDASYCEEQERIVLKAMEKDPSLRYQTADELARDLWRLTVNKASTIALRVDNDLHRKNSTSIAYASTLLAIDDIKANATETSDNADPTNKLITFRFRRIKSSSDKDMITQALEISKRMLRKGANLSIFLDYESANLAQRAEMMAPEFHTDSATTDKIKNIQGSFQTIIKAGGTVVAPTHWLGYFGILAGGIEAILPDITLLDDDELADYLLDRVASVIDYA